MASLEESPSSDEEAWITIPIDRTFSDGDTSTWPTAPQFRLADDSGYRERIAKMWLQKTGAYEEGVNYIIDRLPEGYTLIDRPRGTNPNIRDKFIWGHPCGQYFDSTIKFFPHFYYLMTGGNGKCHCVLCAKMAKQKPGPKSLGQQINGHTLPRSHTLPRRPGRPVVRPIVDSEGTPDVYRMAIKRLKERGSLDEPLQERTSMDWRAEEGQLQLYLAKLNIQASFVPRAGEIVLWTFSLDGELAWNPERNRVQVYSRNEKRWLGDPDWRAGVVGQTPVENVVLKDLVETTPKEWGVNYSGFRVETFPDPNSTDKSYSLHYRYVPLKCIKPFNAFELFCQGIENLHPSIAYAMTVMSSFSLLDKYHFKGTWPNASVYCRGIFLGAELLVIGDAVRLKPRGYTPDGSMPPQSVDVMVIDKIRLELTGCNDDIGSDQLAEKYGIRIEGKVYTNAPSRAYSAENNGRPPKRLTHDEVVNAYQYVGMGGYGPWYPAHPSEFKVEVSPDMIIGRCYEPDAMRLLFGSLALHRDLHGVMSAREYSRQTDERIPEGKHWFWGDYRTETLALHTLNGEDVSHYSEGRDVRMWRGNLKVLDGTASPADVRDARIPNDVGRPPLGNKPSSTFAEVRKTSKLVSTGLGTTDGSNAVSSAEETNGAADEESVSEEEEEDFSKPLPYFRGGTEETEMGDYVPGQDLDRKIKRPKHRK